MDIAETTHLSSGGSPRSIGSTFNGMRSVLRSRMLPITLVCALMQSQLGIVPEIVITWTPHVGVG
ncbi:hypothetical protein AHAS_Ahas01G0099400 [Arachis hypogaea]